MNTLSSVEQVLIVVIFAIFFAALSRGCGGGKFFIHGQVAKITYGLMYAVPLLLIGEYVLGLAATVFGICFKVTGHGQYFDLGTQTKIIKPEKVDLVVVPLFGPDPNTIRVGKGSLWRDFYGLTITGIGVGTGAGVGLISTGHFVEGSVILSTAALKSVAYLIGWGSVKFESVDRSKWWYPPTATGEVLTGFFGGAGLAFATLSVLL